ncbi:hypothetical protein [Pyrococcus kukulkanii]|uniref:Radical SAM core domain-containing protein n=1 Tax=Pyrococcus kukulkanii TaxID=1609559 RepID=A0ABV4T828_9EURY
MKVLDIYRRPPLHIAEGVGSGEHLLIAYSPIFKRRYALITDYYRGCTIGCRFCYYRFIEATKDFIGTGKVLRMARDAEEFIEAIELSKITGRLVIVGGGSDGAMIEKELWKIAEVFGDRLRGKLLLVLRRAPLGPGVAEQMESFDFLRYGTTITPLGPEIGTPIREELQLKGLEKFVPDPSRVSVELGPITPKNYRQLGRVVEALADMGFEAVIYRGVSVGTFNLDRKAVLKMLFEHGFITREQYEKGLASPGYYYSLKNELAEGLDGIVRRAIEDAGLRAHRYSPTFYHEEWGVPIAFNRDNRVRDFLYEKYDVENPSTARVRRALERFGYEVFDIERREKGVFEVSLDRPLTEDIAMAIGEDLRIALIGRPYVKSPTVELLVNHYIPNGVVHLPEENLRLLMEVVG